MIHSFIAHTSPGRSRVFALVRRPGDELEAVTTLGAGDLHLTGELVRRCFSDHVRSQMMRAARVTVPR
jgi:hypothetical protein